MDLFDRKDRQSHTQHEACVCDGKQGVFLNTRHMSWALSVILLLNFFVFMAGYFLGKKKILEQLNYKIDQESLTDHVYSSMYSLYDSKVQPSSSADNVEPEEEIEMIENETASEEPALEQAVDITAQTVAVDELTTLTPTTKEDNHEYYAQLVGFGSKHAAQQFVNKLAQRDITAHIKQRTSKTAKGRVVYWYQVITETFSQKNDLVKLVEAIKRREKLHDVRIITA
jgi:hypothetical protein